MATTTSKFNRSKATLTEINRELKRLASRKCRAKTSEAAAEAAAQYEDLAAFKAKKFQTTRQSYATYSDEAIASLDLETTVKAIKSLQSRRCLYPNLAAETMEVEAKYQAHRAELLERAQLEKLLAKYQA